MTTLSIRRATLADVVELAHLLNLFDGLGATPEQVAARMRACAHVLTTYIAELDGRPVGFACLRLIPQLQGDEPYAELTDIYVDAPFRRRGVARALIAEVEAAAQAAGAVELVILTGFDNQVAQATYRASGYHEWSLAMKKRFTPP